MDGRHKLVVGLLCAGALIICEYSYQTDQMNSQWDWRSAILTKPRCDATRKATVFLADNLPNTTQWLDMFTTTQPVSNATTHTPKRQTKQQDKKQPGLTSSRKGFEDLRTVTNAPHSQVELSTKRSVYQTGSNTTRGTNISETTQPVNDTTAHMPKRQTKRQGKKQHGMTSSRKGFKDLHSVTNATRSQVELSTVKRSVYQTGPNTTRGTNISETTQPVNRTKTQPPKRQTKRQDKKQPGRTSSRRGLKDLRAVTNATHSKIELLTKRSVYQIGQTLQIKIYAKDSTDSPRTRGGDFFKAKLYNHSLLASTSGRVTDHENGTYTVSFRLSWRGHARVEVVLIHPVEAIDVLKRMRDVERKRPVVCEFKSGNVTATRNCYTTPNPDRSTRECDFTSGRARAGWYCERPGDIPCHKITNCTGKEAMSAEATERLALTPTEMKLFNGEYVDQVVSGSFSVEVTAENVQCSLRHSSGLCLHGNVKPTSEVVLRKCGDKGSQAFVHRSDGKLVHAMSKRCILADVKGKDRDGVKLKLGNCSETSLRVRHNDSRTLQDMTTKMCLCAGENTVSSGYIDVVLSSDCENGCGTFEFMEDPSTLPTCSAALPKVRLDSDGFYLQDKWYSRYCNTPTFPDMTSIRQCLSDKTVYFHGDSTVRQWFEFLYKGMKMDPTILLPGLDGCRLGPCMVHDNNTNMHLHSQFHNFPIVRNPFLVQNMQYIVEALDALHGGPNVTFALTIWAHFTADPVHVFRGRILAIRDAILRLHKRSPETLVVIKSANMARSTEYPERRPIKPARYLLIDDWQLKDFNRIMRGVFSDTKAVFLDVWDMTSCHHLPHDIHPQYTVVREEVHQFLGYVCPTFDPSSFQ